MSDPVTNVEIEDVLSSIRRLVSDGDKARTRDPAPEEVAEDIAHDMGFDAADEPESGAVEDVSDTAPPADNLNDRLVLTPAFLVSDGAEEEDHASQQRAIDDVAAQSHEDAEDHEADPGQNDHEDAPDHQSDHHDNPSESEDSSVDMSEDESRLEPLTLTNMVWDEAEDTPANDDQDAETIQTPDRSELVATIAELEAAISTDNAEYEPDGSEEGDEGPIAQTIAWPGTFNRSTEGVEEAEHVEVNTDDAAAVQEVADDSRVMPFHRATPDAAPEFDDSLATDVEDFDESEPDSMVEPAEVEADVYADDDLDDLIEAGGVTLDDEALRAMISEVVREELTGPLGERITRNVRKLVRREIYRVLSSQDFD